MQKLLEIPTGPAMSSGLFPGLPGKEPILWADGENVVFDQGKVRKAQGYVGLADLSARMTGAKAAQLIAERVLYLGGGGAYYRYRASDGLTALKSGLSGAGIWLFAPYGEHLVATDGVNGLRYYDSADAAISTPFTNCRTMFAFRQQIFAAATSNGYNWIEWCDIDNAKTGWTPTLANAAGNLQPRDLDGGFVAAHPLGGDVVGLYTEGSLGHFTYIGGTLQYGYKTRVRGAGAVSHYAVVPVNNKHFSIMRGRAIVTDGLTFDYIDDPAVKTFLEQEVNWGRAAEVFGWHDKLNGLVRWVLPSGASDYVRIGFNYSTKRWTKFNDGVLLGEEAGVWENAMLVKEDRLVRGDPTEKNNDSAGFSSYILTKPLDCGDRERKKVIDKVVLGLEATGTVQMRIGFSEDENDEPDWTPTTYVAVGGDNWLTQADQREGSFVHLKLQSSGVNNSWSLANFSLHGEPGGFR